MKPLLLPPNPVQHFYRGGDRIAKLRGIVAETDHQPEEWLGATVGRHGDADTGLSITEAGLLRDIVSADPVSWVGAVGANPADVGLLVKLLDARQRLPVHVHPERSFAASHLDCPYGKTEAWYVLDAVGDAAVYAGWKTPVDRAELDRRRDAQDSEWMLDHLNRIPVRPGMGIFCPAGTAHAIGEGVFVAEVQEPTDFSILLEWSVTTSTREESHLDLGFDAVMPAVSTDAVGPAELQCWISEAGCTRGAAQPGKTAGAQSLLPTIADPYFRVLRGAASATFPRGFAVVIVTEGAGRLVPGADADASATPINVSRGEAYVVPHAYGSWRLESDAAAQVELLACTPGADWPASLHRGGIR